LISESRTSELEVNGVEASSLQATPVTAKILERSHRSLSS